MPFRTTTAALVLVGVSLALPASAPAQEAKITPDRVKLVRATYRDAQPTTLGIKEPIRVTQLTEQNVPKVINLVATDANGTTHTFSWWLDKQKSQNREFDRIYWQRGGAQGPFRVAVRGPEEAAWYGLLLRYSESQEKASASLGPFEKLMLKEAKALVDRLDGRFGGESPVLKQ